MKNDRSRSARRQGVRKWAAKSSGVMVTDAEGRLVLADELVQEHYLKVGDPFATWKEGDTFKLVFPKGLRRKVKIPKDAFWGKVEPGRKS